MKIIFAGVALGCLLLDQLTKIAAVRFLDPQEPPVLLRGLLTLRLIRNPGAAFSLGENLTIAFALLAVVVITFVGVRLVPRVNHPGWAVALGLLVAGVSGNLMDRIFRAPGFLRGHVVDFFQLPHFAIFNIADICITSAAAMIMVLAVIKNVGLDGHRYARRDVSESEQGRAEDRDPTAQPDGER
ncbi:MAG: signal peptidase II [Microlunatus sp.]|nr:signal peptidase II [Microlunatus sp.]MDN5771814.1 signal peptidase II [Microlunatus sp.]